MEKFIYNCLKKFKGNVSDDHCLDMMCFLTFIAFESKTFENDELQLLCFDELEPFVTMAKKLTGVSNKVLSIIIRCIDSRYIVCSKEINEVFLQLLRMDSDELMKLYEHLIINGANYESIIYRDNFSPAELVNVVLAQSNGSHYQLKVLDACSGKGAFIVAAADYFKDSQFTGIEINSENTVILEMYSLMSGKNISIVCSDFLGLESDDTYDFIFTQFPFNLNVNYWNIRHTESSPFDYSMIKKNANFGFIFKGLDLLKNNGKMVAIVNDGCLFGLGNSDIQNRKQLIDNHLIESVISMPVGTLYGTQVKYSLLVLSKHENEYISFIDASAYYKMNAKKRVIDDEKIMDILALDNSSEIKRVSLDEIIKSEYRLNVDSYMEHDDNGINLDLENSKRLGDLALIFPGLQYTSRTVKELEHNEGKYDVIRIKDIDDIGEIHRENLVSIDIPLKKAEKFLLQENDILVTSKGTTIKLALYRGNDSKTLVNYNMTVIRVTDSSLDPVYLYSFLNSEVGRLILKNCATPTVIMNITRKNLENVMIPVIEADEQEIKRIQYLKLKELLIEYQAKVDSIKEKINDLYKEML